MYKRLFFLCLILTCNTKFNFCFGEQAKDDFNAGDMIMHHISDSHGWHLWGAGEKSVTIPLPVILWTDKKLVIFSSNKFHHDNQGKVIHKTKNGIKFVNFHEKIYQLNEGENNIMYDKDHKIINAKLPLDISITKNVMSLFISILLLIFVFIGISKKYIKKIKSAPTGLQAFIEPIILFVKDDIVKPSIGEKNYKRFLPFLLTLFFFIWINNLLGLIPVFPGGANLTGNIAVPFVLATIILILTTINGKKAYWTHIFAMSGVPKWVLVILTPIEIFGIFLKPLVLMIRLFANITAGHIIMLSFFSLIFIFGDLFGNIAGYGVSVMSIAFTIFMTMLELIVAFLQAYVFTLLSAMYFGMAVEEQHH